MKMKNKKKDIENLFCSIFVLILIWFYIAMYSQNLFYICFKWTWVNKVEKKNNSYRYTLALFLTGTNSRWCWFQFQLQYLKMLKRELGYVIHILYKKVKIYLWKVDWWVEFCFQLLMIIKISLLWDRDIWANLNFWKKKGIN